MTAVKKGKNQVEAVRLLNNWKAGANIRVEWNLPLKLSLGPTNEWNGMEKNKYKYNLFQGCKTSSDGPFYSVFNDDFKEFFLTGL